MRAGRAVLAATLPLALAAGPAAADDDACRRRIDVTGHARAKRPPDFAEVTVGARAKAPDPAAAVDAASKAAGGILDLVRDFGIDRADVGTASVELVQNTRWVTQPDGKTTEEPDGYRAENHLTIRLADMSRLGDLLRRVLSVGANRIQGIGFGLRDPDGLGAELETAAARDARRRAQAIADALGVGLGALCTLSTERGARPVASEAFRFSGGGRMDGPPVPVAGGTIENSAQVSASFAIRP